MSRKHPPAEAIGAWEVTTRSPEETQALGRRLGEALAPGMVVALIGELGSGKTTLIQGIAAGLGVDPSTVKSPTFVLLREYKGRVPVVHIDGYRLEGDAAMLWLDLDWVFSREKVTLIEWADRCAGCLPADHVEIRLAHKTATQRLLSFRPHGPASTAGLAGVRAVELPAAGQAGEASS
jgi:tRNA threonylcarbamoyladenosine biosynthesis protein TsaE